MALEVLESRVKVPDFETEFSVEDLDNFESPVFCDVEASDVDLLCCPLRLGVSGGLDFRGHACRTCS